MFLIGTPDLKKRIQFDRNKEPGKNIPTNNVTIEFDHIANLLQQNHQKNPSHFVVFPLWFEGEKVEEASSVHPDFQYDFTRGNYLFF